MLNSFIHLKKSVLSPQNRRHRSDKPQILFIFKYINKSLKILMKNKTAIHFFSKMDSLFLGLVWETVNGVLYRKIPSPDSS